MYATLEDVEESSRPDSKTYKAQRIDSSFGKPTTSLIFCKYVGFFVRVLKCNFIRSVRRVPDRSILFTDLTPMSMRYNF